VRVTALGIGGERGIELCAVERSTEAIAEPRKARPRLSREGKGGNAQIKRKILKMPKINVYVYVQVVVHLVHQFKVNSAHK
jgi:hypothetical protein